jgi:hypothetical protein
MDELLNHIKQTFWLVRHGFGFGGETQWPDDTLGLEVLAAHFSIVAYLKTQLKHTRPGVIS